MDEKRIQRFEWRGATYEFDRIACYDGASLIVLPDGTVLQVSRWLETIPPRPTGLTVADYRPGKVPDPTPARRVDRTAFPMLAAGQIVEVEVETVAPFGLFCRYEGQEVLVLIPETSWIASFNSSLQFADPGDRLTVKVTGVDADRRKVSASVKAVHPDPWPGDLLAPGSKHRARVVRFVERADRCGDGPGYLLEILPGAYVMLCGGPALEKGQTCAVTVVQSDFPMRAVRVARE
jgi:predicted RNA-binding protein with RPS1 domain